MLSHRDILRDVRRALKALPDHPSACEVTRVPGAGTQTIVVRDASGRPLLTVSALAAVWAPVIPGRHQQTLDAVAPRPELPEVPPLAVDPMAPGVRVLRVGDLVFAPDRATWAVGDIERTADHGVEGEIVRLDLGTRCAVVDRTEITLDTADLWECAKLPVIPAPITETVLEPSTRCETIADVDAMIARDDADAVARESHPIRALIVHDAGADSLGARKGLHAWSAEKTPGAGSQSGGDCAPLVMLWTPRVESPDVEKLLARYAKVKRPVLDLEVIASADRHTLAPFQPDARERWNAAHPAHRVSVPVTTKTGRKDGAK